MNFRKQQFKVVSGTLLPWTGAPMELAPFDLARPLAGLPNLGFPKWCAERLDGVVGRSI